VNVNKITRPPENVNTVIESAINPFLNLYSRRISSNFIRPAAHLMATIIDIKIPKAIATALRIPQNNPQRQQLRV